MNKNIAYLFLFCVCTIQNASSQINMVFNQTNPYEFKVNDIGNFQIINSGNELSVYIKATVSSRGKEIYLLESKTLLCRKGLNQIILNSADIVREFRTKQSPYEILSSTGIFPAGKYEICYRVFEKSQIEEIGNFCFEIEITPISPPTLLSPSNESEVNITNPMLIWMGPVPNNSGFKYELKLTEIIANQSPIDAVSKNFGLINVANMTQTQLIYPFNSAKLENGKRYAWQVIARNNSTSIETEVWTFRVKIDTITEEKIVFFDNYIIPQSNLNSGAVNIKSEIHILIDEDAPIKQLNFELLDINQKRVIENESSIVKYEGGNKFIFGLNEIPVLKDKAYYYLKLRGASSKSTYFVFFRYYK